MNGSFSFIYLIETSTTRQWEWWPLSIMTRCYCLWLLCFLGKNIILSRITRRVSNYCKYTIVSLCKFLGSSRKPYLYSVAIFKWFEDIAFAYLWTAWCYAVMLPIFSSILAHKWQLLKCIGIIIASKYLTGCFST